MNTRLSPSITETQFRNGYWYATELKAFARTIGIPRTSQLRKDEIERAITRFLRTGRIATPPKRSRPSRATRDSARGLRLTLPVVVYTNDAETKRFIEREARKLAPGLKRKSGARYRLNRWREKQLAGGRKLTYGDVVKEYARLCQRTEPFALIRQARYVNFLSRFLGHQRGATRAQAIQAWKILKTLDAPKTYRAWVASRRRSR